MQTAAQSAAAAKAAQPKTTLTWRRTGGIAFLLDIRVKRPNASFWFTSTYHNLLRMWADT